MRENRPYGSEGGVAGEPAIPTPIVRSTGSERTKKEVRKTSRPLTAEEMTSLDNFSTTLRSCSSAAPRSGALNTARRSRATSARSASCGT
jgi:hypothetical protein